MCARKLGRLKEAVKLMKEVSHACFFTSWCGIINISINQLVDYYKSCFLMTTSSGRNRFSNSRQWHKNSRFAEVSIRFVKIFCPAIWFILKVKQLDNLSSLSMAYSQLWCASLTIC